MNRHFNSNLYRLNMQNNMRNMPFTRSFSIGKAIGIPKPTGLFRNLASSSINSTSKLGISGILGNINKTITTVNQAMPLINQVKPLFGNMKSVVNVVKGFRKQNINKTNNPKPKEDIDVNISDNTSKTTNVVENVQENYQFTPNKPYFS